MAAPMKTLEDWLSDRLLAANPDVDLEIFVPYVTGILDTDTSTEDKRESLEEVLEQVVESSQAELCAEIIREWEKRNTAIGKDQTSGTEKRDLKLSDMMGQTNIAVVKPRVLTDEEKARKAAIIAQYDHLSDGDEEDTEEDGAKAVKGAPQGGASSDDWMSRNMNSLSVLEAEREKREKSKQDHEKKKEKDRTDREAQRQKQQERKDAEKKRTQKGEKRR